jgi:hypothetical protein
VKCFDDSLRDKLVAAGIDDAALESIESCSEKLSSYQVAVLDFGDPSEISEHRRARNNLELLRQGLLHRSVGLSSGVALLAGSGSIHGIALCARGQLEATAQLGYFCHRLSVLERNKADYQPFCQDLAFTLLAASHSLIKDAPKPLNILTCIEKSDAYLKRNHDIEEVDGVGPIRDCYGWLSDYCHPNFLSSSSSFLLDKSKHQMVFQHSQGLLARNADLFHSMALGLQIFDIFWNDINSMHHVLEED